MELGFSPRDQSNIVIANGWEEWNTNRTFWSGNMKRAESEPSTALSHSGIFSQKQHMRYTLWRGGIQQKIRVTPGQWYRFVCWAWVYCSTRDDNISAGGTFHARVGINPWGGSPQDYQSIFGKEIEKREYNPQEGYDRWVQVEVIAPAFGNVITVFTEGMPEHAVSHNDVYWDDATFERVEFGGTTPEPEPEPQPGGNCDLTPVLEKLAQALVILQDIKARTDAINATLTAPWSIQK